MKIPATMVSFVLLLIASFCFSPSWAQAEQRVLFVAFNSNLYNDDGVRMYQTIQQAGATADYVLLDTNGKAAALLAQRNYDQVWVYDLSIDTDNYPSDYQAIANWFLNKLATNANLPIICDARFLSSYWDDTGDPTRWQNEGKNLSKNYYENLKIRGGGLVLGTDHDAYFTVGINSINQLIGLNPFTGNFNLSFIPVDTTHPLMSFPNNLGTQLFDDSTPGRTPYGLQPSGRVLKGVAYHGANLSDPGISSTINPEDLFSVMINSPANNLAFPSGTTINFSATAMGGTSPYIYTWTSNLQGALGTGANLSVVLNRGTHTVKVVAQDNFGRLDEKTVVVNITPTPPFANDDSYSTFTCLSINVPAPGVLQNDTDFEHDPLTATLVSPPQHASEFIFNPNGSFFYVPQVSYQGGVDSFTYRAKDASGQSNLATVFLRVQQLIYGDTNGDRCVNDFDLAAVIFDFGGMVSGQNGSTDLNCDGTVDDFDLAIVIFEFGEGC